MKLSTLLVSACLTAAPVLAWEGGPSRDDLMKAAPNPAWNGFVLGGHDMTEIDDGLYMFRMAGTRSMILVTGDGVIATDPVNTEHARVMREEIAKITDQPVKYVIYSHEHWDHSVGGQIFKDEGATFISHENCAKHFADLPHPDIVMPDVTFADDYTLELGGRKLDLLYFGPNHGDCMVVMRPDPGDYLFIVDLVTPGGAPLGFMPDYSPHHYVRTLKEIEDLDYTAILGGHGALVAHPSAVTERRQYLEALLAAVKYARESGVTNIREMVRLPQFEYLRGYDDRIEDNVRRIQTYYGIGW